RHLRSHPGRRGVRPHVGRRRVPDVEATRIADRQRRRLARRAPTPPPPPITTMPTKKPKSYQLPLFATSYTLTRSVNSEMKNVIGKMIPCQSPDQKSASPFPAAGFGPAAHAESRTS